MSFGIRTVQCCRACFDVSTGFRGSSESGSVPERSVLYSSGVTGRAAEPQVDIDTHSVQSVNLFFKRRWSDYKRVTVIY